jgi:hypothetical protein
MANWKRKEGKVQYDNQAEGEELGAWREGGVGCVAGEGSVRGGLFGGGD